MFWNNILSEHQKYAFSQNQVLAFFTNTVIEGIHMLPKKSTRVDQNLASESTTSQLSVAIFMASRTHLGTQKCIILGFFHKKRGKGALDPTNFGFCPIPSQNGMTLKITLCSGTRWHHFDRKEIILRLTLACRKSLSIWGM